MILDVGCGSKSLGDVNVDLFKNNSPHNSGRSVDLFNTKNFVIADVNHLPFKNKVFSKSVCNQVLEHKGVNPALAIAELIRVTVEEVDIAMPHYSQVFLEKYLFPIHCHTNVLTPRFFHLLLKNYPHKVEAIKWRFTPTRWGRLPIYAPNDMKVGIKIS